MIKLPALFSRQKPQPTATAVRNWQDEMSSARLHETFAPIIQANEHLCNFLAVRDLTWTSDSHPPIRPILTFHKKKGGELWPIFGVSADFVPVIDGKRAILHSGPKAAKLDILIDPRDHRRSIHFFSGPSAATEDLQRALPEVLKRAVPFWSKFNSVESLAEAVKYQENHTTAVAGLGVENYLQASFARPFLLAASNTTELADSHWRTFEANGWLDETGLRKANAQYLNVRSGKY